MGFVSGRVLKLRKLLNVFLELVVFAFLLALHPACRNIVHWVELTLVLGFEFRVRYGSPLERSLRKNRGASMPQASAACYSPRYAIILHEGRPSIAGKCLR